VRSSMIAVLGAATLAVLGGFAYVSDHTRRDAIARGVSIGGVDVGGLSRDAAFSRLRESIDTPLQRTVVVVARGHDRGRRRAGAAEKPYSQQHRGFNAYVCSMRAYAQRSDECPARS